MTVAADNPFQSYEDYTTLTIECSQAAVSPIEARFEEEALSLSYFEKEKGAFWQVSILLAGVFDCKDIDLSAFSGVRSFTLAPLEMQDWVTENQKNFPPIEVGSFYIHGSHLPPKATPAISLQIDAGRAFGTGEHATTAGCLVALQQLCGQHEFPRIADIGCGTGILALAAARLWPKAEIIIASDLDAPAVDTAIENAQLNGIDSVSFLAASGTDDAVIQQSAPYDLLIANILAGPLIDLAADFAAITAPTGRIVLSGLLTRQEPEVLEAYVQQGWQLQEALHRDEWSALILVKR